MISLRVRLNMLLNSMELGHTVTLKSGHTLAMDEMSQEPGFVFTKYWAGSQTTEEVLMQIGSNEVWRFLIDHAKAMTDEELCQLAAGITLTEFKREFKAEFKRESK